MEFVHSPLPKRARAIRLLDLHPAYEKQAEIRCRIRDANLDDRPSYKALSYVWGNPDVTLPIIVNAGTYHVTQNCHAALQRLRNTDRSCVWVDAVCINQEDDQEKSAQIPLMREIYSMAEEVIIWLGKSKSDWKPSDDMDEDLAFELIKQLSRFGQVIEDLNSFIDVSRSTNEAEEEFQRKRWQALANLFYHPWFQRLWTYQEVVVSSRATVLGLFRSIKWREFGIAAETIQRHADKDIEWALEISRYPSIQGLSSWVTYCEGAMVMPRLLAGRLYDTQKKRLSTMSIVDILQTTRRYLCVDPRDRIFAIHGLSDDATSVDFFPDYAQTVSQVYTRCTLSIIKATRSLSPLCLTGLQSDPYIPSAYQSLAFPSWVVDWESELRSQPSSLEYRLYHASLESEPVFIFHESTQTLKVYGILVDTVSVASKDEMALWMATVKDEIALWMASVKDGDIELFERFMKEKGIGFLFSKMFLWDSFRTWQERFKVYPTGCDAGHAWIRTITADIGREEGTLKKARLTDKIVRRIYALTRIFDISAEEMLHEFCLSDTDNVDVVLRTVTAILLRAVMEITKKKSFFITRTGYFGLGPLALEEGDMVCVLPGCSVPLLIRKRDYYHVLVGECFVWGLMDGEAMLNRKIDEDYELFNLK
jgi:hypothetical protein